MWNLKEYDELENAENILCFLVPCLIVLDIYWVLLVPNMLACLVFVKKFFKWCMKFNRQNSFITGCYPSQHMTATLRLPFTNILGMLSVFFSSFSIYPFYYLTDTLAWNTISGEKSCALGTLWDLYPFKRDPREHPCHLPAVWGYKKSGVCNL